MIPNVKTQDIPLWLTGFLRSMRSLLLLKFFGAGNSMGKVVTFKNMVDMGILDESQVKRQAGE